jgi:hypothetical protein
MTAIRMLLPEWGKLEPIDMQTVESATRAIDGRGWPMTALWCERDPVSGYATGGALGARRPPRAIPGVPLANPFTMSEISGLITPTASAGSMSPTPGLLAPALPIRIAWLGFLLDTAFYMFAIGTMLWLLIRPWQLAVEVSRLRKGRCLACGYDLRYDFPAGCPECGWRRPAPKT